MACPPIHSNPANQPIKNWLISPVGSYHGFAVPRHRQTVINGNEPLSKRPRTEPPVKPLDNNFSDNKVKMIDPHGNMRDLTNCDDVETVASNDVVQFQNDQKTSRMGQSELAEFQQMVDENDEANSQTSFRIPRTTPSRDANCPNKLDQSSKATFASPLANTPQSLSHTHRKWNKLQKIFIVKYMPCDCQKIFFNRQQFNHHMNLHGEDMDNIESRDLVPLQNNLETSRTRQGEAAEQQIVDEKYDNEESPQTSFRSRNISPNRDVVLTATVSTSPPVGRNKCSVGDPSGTTWQCQICFRPFSSKSNCRHHTYTHYSEKELKKTKIFHDKCGPCNKIFFNRKQFNEHMDMHFGRKKYSCPICEMKFTHQGALAIHRFVHLDPEEKSRVKERWKYKCYFCQNKFTTPSRLHTHFVVHTGETPFQCPKCRRQFKYKSALTAHEKTVHLRQSKFPCPECSRKFPTTGVMKRHLDAVHLRIRHSCSDCDKNFSRKSYLRRHEKHAHPIIHV